MYMYFKDYNCYISIYIYIFDDYDEKSLVNFNYN